MQFVPAGVYSYIGTAEHQIQWPQYNLQLPPKHEKRKPLPDVNQLEVLQEWQISLQLTASNYTTCTREHGKSNMKIKKLYGIN